MLTNARTNRGIIIVATVGAAISLALRLIHYDQNLWCDEMGVPLAYHHAKWWAVVAPAAGEYSPGDHPFFILLAKGILQLSGASSVEWLSRLSRLPSLVAGSLLPLAVAWPFRRRRPAVAVLLLAFAAAEPWFVAFSDEARGYGLMMLLGVIATNLLPDGTTRWPIGYAIVIALMIYTVPVAGMLVAAQGAAVMVLRPEARRAWWRGALVGGSLAAALYLPMARGIWFYLHHPQAGPDNFGDFVNQLPRLAWAGDYLPRQMDPVSQLSDPAWGIFFWILPVLVLIAGSCFARCDRAIHLPMATMGIATLLFFVAAMFIPGAGQARFVPWCAVWIIMACVAIVMEIHRRLGRMPMALAVLVILGWFIYRDVVLLPAEPIREGIQLADQMVPQGQDICVGFLSAEDSVALYGPSASHHQIIATPGPVAFVNAAENVRQTTGHAPWLIIVFERMVHDTTPQFWRYIQTNYQLQARLPGRISPVAIYAPREG